jgi:hypothetical protein
VSANSTTPAYLGLQLIFKLEAATGFEPVIRVLQTRALPLGYAAVKTKAEDGIRTRDPHLGKVIFYH